MIMNTKKLSPYIWIPLLLLLGSLFYQMFNPGFFPTSGWEKFSRYLIIVLAVPLYFFIFWNVKQQKIDLPVKSPLYRLFALIVGPFILLVMLYVIVSLSVPHLITKVFGVSAQIDNVAYVLKTPKHRRFVGTRYCLITRIYGDRPFSDICVSRDAYATFPKAGLTQLSVRSSFFGTSINSAKPMNL